MKLKALKGFCLTAGKDVAAGDVFEAADMDAEIHLQKGRAIKVEEKPKAKTASQDKG